ncbi:MAG: alpha/beta fold hydrolase, partial [Opitutae bacterium]|nr:alpha/beta fold hydrolase [Opitutae bacterium]
MRLFQGGTPSADLTVTSVLVFLTVGAVGGWSWWLLLARKGRVSEGRGAMAGALTALLGYLLIFQVANLVYGAAVPMFLNVSPVAKIVGGLILSVVTLLFSGWFVIPLLALVGAGLALLQRAATPSLEGGLIKRMRGLSQRSASLLRGRPLVRAIVAVVCIIGLLVTSAGVWVWSRPLFVGDLAAAPAPVTDYGASVAAIEAQIAAEAADPTLNPTCTTRLFTPGHRTERVVIFFHGFTNCPAQFVPLAEQLVARGYSVYIPRVPRHGITDRLTTDLAGLSADDLVRFSSRSVDLAQGLGEQVDVVGLSMGATMAAWIAQHRSDVAQVTLIAPLFQIAGLPPFAIRPVASTILAVPNFYMWWDNQRHEQIIGPPYAYPRYPVHA